MLYIAYLDEFGHIGPYISHDDPRHKTHPVFGLGGIVLPYSQVRGFSTFFFKLKKDLLSFEINQSGEHPARWEKKGSALYTIKNIEKYKQLRQSTFRLLNKIDECGGYVFYVGIEKRRGEEDHHSKKLFHSVLREALKRLNRECERRNDQFMVVMDQQEERNMRPEIVQTAAIEMFGGDEPRRQLLEPPLQVESHLYQTIQCADWICGVVGRLSQYEVEPEEKPELAIANKYFHERIIRVSKRSSIRMFDK